MSCSGLVVLGLFLVLWASLPVIPPVPTTTWYPAFLTVVGGMQQPSLIVLVASKNHSSRPCCLLV